MFEHGPERSSKIENTWLSGEGTFQKEIPTNIKWETGARLTCLKNSEAIMVGAEGARGRV